VNEVRLLGRVALALALLALVAAGLVLHGLRAQRIAAEARLGATLAGRQPVVTSLRRGGMADRAGLEVGDVVEMVDGHATASLAELEHAVASGAPAGMRIRRGRREIAVVVR
jgi:S1-C subfamily serine protease